MKPLTLQDGWFRTGDLGELDAEGNLYFKGRSKNVMVTPAGMNVHPEGFGRWLCAGSRRCVTAWSSDCRRNGNAEPCAVLILEPGADAARVLERANASLSGISAHARFIRLAE